MSLKNLTSVRDEHIIQKMKDDDAFFTTIALVCGPPAQDPRDWSIEQRREFIRLVESQPHVPQAEGHWARSERFTATYYCYTHWYERNG